MSANNKNRKKYLQIIAYRFNEFFQKGVIMQFLMLIVAVCITVVIFGFIVGLVVEGESTRMGMWHSLMHMLDQGTLGNDSVDDIGFISVMFVVTMVGLILMGTIIGIIDNAISGHINKLKEGTTKVMEEGHMVIIGFDDNIHCIIGEQMESNENYEGNRAIVVLDDYDIDEMRSKIAEKMYPQRKSDRKIKKSKIIYRKGSVANSNSFDMVSADKAKSIIINNEDDFEVIRIMLALSKYLKNKHIYKTDKMPNIVSMMHREENIEAAKVAIENVNNECDKIQVLYFENVLAHIMAQVCRQPGLSWVVSEIFDYANSEIYIENICDGKPLFESLPLDTHFDDLHRLFTTSIPIGICDSNGKITINPKNNPVINANDRIIHIASDDNKIKIGEASKYSFYGCEAERKAYAQNKPYHIVIFGWNEPLPNIIENIYDFLPDDVSNEKSTITIVANNGCEKNELIYEAICKKNENEAFPHEEGTNVFNFRKADIIYENLDPYQWNQIKPYLEERVKNPLTNILLLCQDGIDKIEADRKTAVLLLNIRFYLETLAKSNKDENVKNRIKYINITSEMNLAEDQSLLQDSSFNDFVVGSEMANRMMVQVANNPIMYKVFHELLNDEKSEIYLRYIADYVDIESDFNWNYLAEKAAEKGEIAIGWVRYENVDGAPEITLNPLEYCDNMNNRFGNRDRLVVIAED